MDGTTEDQRFEQDICLAALMREYAGNLSTLRLERRGDALHITTRPDPHTHEPEPAREIIVHVTVTITEAE